jgi:hypothetical protein
LNSYLGQAALACANGAEAVALFARTAGVLEAAGEISDLSSVAATQALALLFTGGNATARQHVELALETGSTDDVVTQSLARGALAWLGATDGEDPATVRRHMAEARAALETTELILDRALVHAACAEAAKLLGDQTAAREQRQRTIDLYVAKENHVGAAAQRALLVADDE